MAAPQQSIIKADNEAQAAARAALLSKLAEPEPAPTIVKADNDAQAAARAALLGKLGEPEPVAVTPTPAAPTPAPATVASPAPAPVPSPIALSKQERLQELLVRYKANEITPLEYHTKRAAIVNGE
jgi:hypothetical protein